MRHAVLSPIYKEKGERCDPKMYRPVSVTTIEYRILAKCMALKLNPAIAHLIGDPQVGFSPGRTYDENIALVRETIASINHRHPGLGGMMLFLDNEKAFDKVPREVMNLVMRKLGIEEWLVKVVMALCEGTTA